MNPKIIMSRPDTLALLTRQYFDTLDALPPPEQRPPTAAGLTLFLGFSSTPMMLASATNVKYPEESRHIILSALTTIEDTLIAGGLTERLNVTMAKHILSAQHEVIPKKEIHEVNDTAIAIRVISHTPSSPTEALEMERLETLLIEQSATELASMSGAANKTTINREAQDTPTPAPTMEDLY